MFKLQQSTVNYIKQSFSTIQHMSWWWWR